MSGALTVCFAVKEEARPFQRLAKARVLLTGMGQSNAEAAIRLALKVDRPRAVITSGFAGALRPNLPTGAVLFSAAQTSGLERALPKAGALPGTFHCASRVVVTRSEKALLREQTGADAVEMESGVIGEVCRQSGVPCAIVRVILDTADEDLPLDFNVLVTPSWRLHTGKLALALLRSPAVIPRLLRFQKQVNAAAEELSRVLDNAIQLLDRGQL